MIYSLNIQQKKLQRLFDIYFLSMHDIECLWFKLNYKTYLILLLRGIPKEKSFFVKPIEGLIVHRSLGQY